MSTWIVVALMAAVMIAVLFVLHKAVKKRRMEEHGGTEKRNIQKTGDIGDDGTDTEHGGNKEGEHAAADSGEEAPSA